MKNASLIELKAVQRRQDTGLLALDGVDLRIAPGEFVGLLGPQGRGKSSLLRLLAGVDRPTAGQVLRRGDAAARAAPGEVGQVFAAPTLMSWATLATNIELPLRLQGLAAAPREQAARAALAELGLGPLADGTPRDLSTTQKMRAALARAWVTQPALMLLDDPFTALDDAAERDELMAALQALWRPADGGAQAEGHREVADVGADVHADALKGPDAVGPGRFAAVYATRDVDTALRLCQRVLLIGGRPGKVLKEVRVDAPLPRGADFLSSPAAQQARLQIQRTLARASDDALVS